MWLPQPAQSMLVASTVVSTFTFLATITALPMFFMKVQRINSQMLTELRNCHQDSTDIWKQLSSQGSVRSKRSYGRDVPSIPNGKCCSCQQGKPGSVGPKGADGAAGAPGLIGLNGRNGRNGKYVASEHHNEPACQKCPTAPPGPPGHPGRKGPRGASGNPGIGGNNGIPGRMGPPGPPGVRGPPGDLGMQGPQGDPGKVLNGAPQGQPGRPGRVGARGKAGFTGRDGRPGFEGTPGTRGVQGERGSRGARGPPGPPGPSGTDGRRGSCAHCDQGDKDLRGREEELPPTPTAAPVVVHHPSAAPPTTTTTSFPVTSSPSASASEEEYIETIVPKTLNYPDTVARPSHKHDGDVTNAAEDVVIPAGRYSASPARQYASKSVGAKAVHFGYSNDQLSAFAPMSNGDDEEAEEEYGKPRAFQTNKGYNVQIMGSSSATYGAAPVASGWQQPGRAGVKFLPPPAYHH